MAYINTYEQFCDHDGEHCDGAEFCNTCKVQIFSGFVYGHERYCNDHKPATWDAEIAEMTEDEFDWQDNMYWTQWEIDDIYCECPDDCPCRPAPEALQALYDADRARDAEDSKTEAYIAADGNACPGCGDTRFTKYVKGAPGFTASLSRPDRPVAWVQCTECKATWTEEYTLTGYSNLSYDRPIKARPAMVYDPLTGISRANYNEPGRHTG